MRRTPSQCPCFGRENVTFLDPAGPAEISWVYRCILLGSTYWSSLPLGLREWADAPKEDRLNLGNCPSIGPRVCRGYSDHDMSHWGYCILHMYHPLAAGCSMYGMVAAEMVVDAKSLKTIDAFFPV